METFGRTVVEVDLGVLMSNVAALRGRMGWGARLAGVVKGDGYGHGLVEVSRAVLAGGADWLAVALVTEGVALRHSGITSPILVMGYVSPSEWREAVEANLTVAVSSENDLKNVAQAALDVEKQARVHVKVDTGLHRFGADPAAVARLLGVAFQYPQLQVEGIFSHFAAAYSPDLAEARAQFDLFWRVCTVVAGTGYSLDLKHIANSPAFLYMPETHMDMVRVGRLLYGVYPHAASSAGALVRPALRWLSRVVVIRRVQAGDRVGYYPASHLAEPRTVGVVPVGYGDGLPERLAGRSWFLVRGKRVSVLSVCMDVTFIDVTEVPEIQVGDEVVIIGRQGGEAIRAEDLGEILEVCPVSLFTGISRRVPRVYVGSGNKENCSPQT